MRKTGIVLLVIVLAVALLAAPSSAGKKKKKKVRKVEETYVTPAIGAAGAGLFCQAEPFGCVRLEIEPGERFVDVELQDSTGQPVYASVYVFGYSDGTDSHDHICGKSDDPLQLGPGVKELVIVVEGTGGATSGCPGPPTVGAVLASFSDR